MIFLALKTSSLCRAFGTLPKFRHSSWLLAMACLLRTGGPAAFSQANHAGQPSGLRPP
jgi:hypothetical protein